MNSKNGLIIGITISLLLTLLIWLLTPLLSRFESTLLPDSGANWYYWKLPNRDAVVQTIVWILYAAHQIFVWFSFYYARKHNLKFSDKLSKINYVLLVGNLVFVLLRILQTHLWYDGLAQDAPIWSSQWSVILFLSFMLVIDNPRRGLLLGVKAPFSQRITNWIKTYHPYYFWWAFVYTFWFHPATGTIAHLFGFLYMFLLFTQGSLMYTTMHLNKYWMAFLESFVLLHGTIVALYQGTPLWSMFFFGFLGMVIFTYIHGLGLSKKTKYIMLASYLLLILFVYLPNDSSRLLRLEPLWIPIILYLVAVLFAVLGGLIFKLFFKEDASKGKHRTN
jgi:hypothetical protein